MSFAITPETGIPIPRTTRRGELSVYAKELLKLEIGQSFPFDPETEDGKKIKYFAQKLQKDGIARFSFRKGRNGKPARMWRVELASKTSGETTSAEV